MLSEPSAIMNLSIQTLRTHSFPSADHVEDDSGDDWFVFALAIKIRCMQNVASSLTIVSLNRVDTRPM